MKKCLFCGKRFKKRFKRKYCSTKCRDKFVRRKWKHGELNIIKAIYKRDNRSCALCGISEKQHKKIAYRNRSLLIHHIDNDKDNNDVCNQQLLCVRCHNKLHGQLKRLKFKFGGIFKLHKEIFLRCAHQLKKGYPYKCKNIHGEYYRVRLWIIGQTLDKYGLLVDFKFLTELLKDRYDHKFINQISPFDKLNPTVENLTQYLFFDINKKLSDLITQPILIKIRVYESNNSYCEFSENENN